MKGELKYMRLVTSTSGLLDQVCGEKIIPFKAVLVNTDLVSVYFIILRQVKTVEKLHLSVTVTVISIACSGMSVWTVAITGCVAFMSVMTVAGISMTSSNLVSRAACTVIIGVASSLGH
ncbi:hypothetical protein CHS0354_039741, partial [Potamilus streckersoni]